MFKKAIKYFLVILVNAIILLFLMSFWIDDVESELNVGVYLIEYFSILGYSLLSLLAVRIALYFFRTFNVSINKRILFSFLITFVVSSNMYYQYSKNIYQNCFEDRAVRLSLSEKIKPAKGLAYGTKADSLSFKEYEMISEIGWYPKLQKEAKNISYYYTYDGFLPDYTFLLKYDLPLNIKVDSTNLINGNIDIILNQNSKKITFEKYDD